MALKKAKREGNERKGGKKGVKDSRTRARGREGRLKVETFPSFLKGADENEKGVEKSIRLFDLIVDVRFSRIFFELNAYARHVFSKGRKPVT